MNDENMNNVGIAGMLRRMADSGYYNTTEFEGMNVTEILKKASDEIICLTATKFMEEMTKNMELEAKMKEVGEIKAAPNCKYYMPCGLCEK